MEAASEVDPDKDAIYSAQLNKKACSRTPRRVRVKAMSKVFLINKIQCITQFQAFNKKKESGARRLDSISCS